MRRKDPGNPDVCNVFTLHKTFSTNEQVAAIDVECRRAGIGCVDCKKILAANLNEHLADFRQQRTELGQNPGRVWDILHAGKERAHSIAAQTMAEVRAAVGLPD
jgi:tryptophanyl-tRNA synthetase